MRVGGFFVGRFLTCHRHVGRTCVLLTLLPLCASALTVRSKSDLRLWETVTDLAQPLSWAWETNADAALLTFSNQLTEVVTSTNVLRTVGSMHGSCEQPALFGTDATLITAVLVQSTNGVEVARETAALAYVPGAAGRPLTVRTKGDRYWRHVERPRCAAFDASWWNVLGPSGYEVMWATLSGRHRVVREFAGVGPVDETVLKFGIHGLLLLLR